MKNPNQDDVYLLQNNNNTKLNEMLMIAGICKNSENYFFQLSYLLGIYQKALLKFCEDKIRQRSKSLPTKDIRIINEKSNDLLEIFSNPKIRTALSSATIETEYKNTCAAQDINQTHANTVTVRYNIDLAKVTASLIELSFASEQYLTVNDEFRKKGRPTLESYYEFVMELSRAYVVLSKKRFTCFRHKSDENVYLPITDGHKFIHTATEQLNTNLARIYGEKAESFSDKNIYNACEKAVSKLLKNYKNSPIKDFTEK